MIEAKALTKKYKERVVVDGVDLRVERGQIYALLGGNGAGKTTTLHMLLGLIAIDAGEALIDGKKVGDGERPKLAFVPEVVELYPDLSPLETLELFAGVAGIAVTARAIVEALSHAGLAETFHEQRLRTLSKGMRQKVALASAEIQGARAVFLDEPTSGLDPIASDALMQRLREMRDAGAAILMTTHDVLQVEGVADRIGIMQRGKLVVERARTELSSGGLLALYRETVA